jgi:hypothetical protein
MKKQKAVQPLESFYQTENEWHNSKVVSLIAEARKESLFEDLAQAVRLWNFGLEAFQENPEAPLQVAEALNKEFKKVGLDEAQGLFILQKVSQYLKHSTFEEEGISDETKKRFLTIFTAEVENRKAQIIELKPQKPLVKNLRATLKEWVQQELEKLPETLEQVDPERRVNLLCKFLPFVLPRVESVHSEQDEDDKSETWGVKW